MLDRPEAPQNIDEELAHFELTLSQQKYLSVDDQQVLRLLLREVPREQHELRARILALLNPRHATVIYLSEQEFREGYQITTEDNYHMHDIKAEDIYAVFDAEHGYYVTGRIALLE